MIKLHKPKIISKNLNNHNSFTIQTEVTVRIDISLTWVMTSIRFRPNCPECPHQSYINDRSRSLD